MDAGGSRAEIILAEPMTGAFVVYEVLELPLYRWDGQWTTSVGQSSARQGKVGDD